MKKKQECSKNDKTNLVEFGVTEDEIETNKEYT